MRIGVMLRSMEENQGIGIYTRNVLPRLLRLDSDTEYVLIRRHRGGLGALASYANATEVVLDLPTKALWDQVGVPRLARRYGLDLVFNTKFTVPLLTRCRTVMTVHGIGWYTHPGDYHAVDVAYMRAFLPVYCRKADHLISNSQSTTDDFVRLLGIARDRITTIHFAADDHFRPVTDQAGLREVREKYRLPKEFVLSVTKYYRGKNVPTLIGAYSRLATERRLPLVLVGRGVERYLDELGLRGTPIAREIILPGWVPQEDLPAIYSQASMFVLPSSFESFGIPLIEAMACGCPVVSSRAGAIPELTADAAELVAPGDEDALLAVMERLLDDSAARARMRERGLERAKAFSWAEHAVSTLRVFRSVGRGIEHRGLR